MGDKNNYGKCNSAVRHIYVADGNKPDGLPPIPQGDDLPVKHCELMPANNATIYL